MASKNRNLLPSNYVPVGGVIAFCGGRFRCVVRPEGLHWTDSCLGCGLRRFSGNCGDYQCSRFDRRDGLNVWYEDYEG